MNLKDFTETSAPEGYRHVSKPQPEAASDSDFSTRNLPSSMGLSSQPQPAAAIGTARACEVLWGAAGT